MGSSYGGATQHALAIANAPYVKAMIPRNAMSNFGRYGVRHNGAFELRFFNWVLTLGSPPETQRTRRRRDARPRTRRPPALLDMGDARPRLCARLPLRAGTTPLKFAPDYESVADRGHESRRLRRFLEKFRLERGRPSGRIQGRSRISHNGLV